MRRKPITILPEDVAFWKETTGREPFIAADRVCKNYAKEGRRVRVVWQSARCISVIPEAAPVVAFRKRARK